MDGGAGFPGSTEAAGATEAKSGAEAEAAEAVVDTAVETKRRGPKPTSKSSPKTTEAAMHW